MVDEPPKEVPERIRTRLAQIVAEGKRIVDGATSLLVTPPLLGVSLRFQDDLPGDFLTPFERAQSVSFVTRYESLPTECTVQVVRDGTEFRIGNLESLRSILNEWRPIIELQRDPCYYMRIHGTWFKKLGLKNIMEGLRVTAGTDDGVDETPHLKTILGERNQVVTEILRRLDYDYLYNGILQHSDERHSSRFLSDYTSGELNYLLWKHVDVLGVVHQMLEPIYQVVNQLTHPRPGAL